MGAVERVVIPYTPRVQQRAIHEALDKHRFGVLVCHRRFGKTVLAINHLLRSALMCQRERPRLAYIAPTYKQAKAIAWDYLKHYARPLPGVEFNESELRVDLPNGGRVRLYGADNPDSLRGIYLDGCVLDEYGHMPGNTFSEVIRPALADREGWALFEGTPNGKNQFWDIAQTAQKNPDWYFGEYRASKTKILPDTELALARQTMTDDEYKQEFECSFEASVKGAIYGDQLSRAREQGRIREVPYSRELPVHTFWDLGVGDATSIWFVQGIASEVRVLDYYEASGEGLPHYKKVLTERGYQYGDHWAPHDIEVREFSSGRSRLETARSLGINFRIVPKMPLEDGIHAGRMLIERAWFDREKCEKGLEALQNYRWEFNTRLSEYKAVPVHDWSSHAADAWRYLAVAWKPRQKEEIPEIESFPDGI